MADGVGNTGRGHNDVRGEGMTSGLPLSALPLRVANFVGRQIELERMERALWEAPHAVAIVPASARALEGVGKTSLAVAYAERNRDRYAGICWVDARHADATPHQLIARAGRTMPIIQAERKVSSALRKALDLYARPIDGRPWLVILDDLDDVEALPGLLPGGQAQILITSNRAFWPKSVATVGVDIFPTEVAAAYLMRTGASVDASSANALALQLGYLPLALFQASEYCRRTGMGATSYARLADQWSREVKMRGVDSPVFATSSIALDQVKTLSKEAEPLLDALALLGANGIRPEWFPGTQSGGLQNGITRRGDTFELLCDWSLAYAHTSEEGLQCVSVHPLVQRVIRQRAMTRNAMPKALEFARQAIEAGIDAQKRQFGRKRRNWSGAAGLLAHGLALIHHGAGQESGQNTETTLATYVDQMLDKPKLNESRRGWPSPAMAGATIAGLLLAGTCYWAYSDPQNFGALVAYARSMAQR